MYCHKVKIISSMYVTDSGGSKKGGWKDRIMARSFKKQTAVSLQLSSHAAMFGVPLEDCIPSPSNEVGDIVCSLLQ